MLTRTIRGASFSEDGWGPISPGLRDLSASVEVLCFRICFKLDKSKYSLQQIIKETQTK